MARVITKELAVKIKEKLKAKKSPSQRKGSAHDLFDFEYNGVLILQISIRRGSEKDLGHDHMPEELHLGPNQAKRLGQCPLKYEAYLDILREKGLLPEDETDDTSEEQPPVT